MALVVRAPALCRPPTPLKVMLKMVVRRMTNLTAPIVFGCVCVMALFATAAFAQPVQALGAGTASNDLPRDEQSLAFGEKILDIALAIDPAAQQSLAAAPETAAPATMTFTDASGADRTYHVTLHIKGGVGSRQRLDEKPAFSVALGKGDRFFGLEHLTLNNMVQDPTMLHEALGYQVYEAAGVKVATTGYVRLTVNGQAYGLYLNLETLDTHFLKRRFGDDSGILYEGAYGVDLRAGDVEKFELHEGADPNRATLKALIRALDAPGEDIFYGVRPQVDVVSFLAMMAAEALLGDWDSYYTSNNYRIYWNPSASRWFFIPTGIDQSFNSTTVFGATGLLFQKCLASERCTKDYADTVQGVAARFDGLGLLGRMDALLSVIDAASQADPRKKYDAATMTNARKGMRSLIAKRSTDVRAALSCIDGDHEATLGACAGVVAVNAAVNQCAEVVSSETTQGGTVSVAPCSGAANQRWRLVPMGEVVKLTAVSTRETAWTSRTEVSATARPCSNGPAPMSIANSSRCDRRFRARSLWPNTRANASLSRRAIRQGAALIQVTCAQDAAQTWHVQRSIYK